MNELKNVGLDGNTHLNDINLNKANNFFFFTDLLTKERLQWLVNINGRNFSDLLITFCLSGDALYSLLDKSLNIIWKEILLSKNIRLIIDTWQLNLLGFTKNKIFEQFDEGINKFHFSDTRSQLSYWIFIIDMIKSLGFHNETSNMGVLQLESPYFNRSSVFISYMLKSIQSRGFDQELYCYLDGITLGHNNQTPSEFENIGNYLESCNTSNTSNNTKLHLYACSRCATARGYVDEHDGEGNYISNSVIEGFNICNLNKIIDRFEENFPIIANQSGFTIQYPNIDYNTLDNEKPRLLFLVTRSPYQREYVFGALSFASAAVNHGIKTDVIFLEDGIYSLSGDHTISPSDKIFNIQEIIYATEDNDLLQYYVYLPSLTTRGMEINPQFEEILEISEKDLSELLLFKKSKTFYHTRFFIF